VLPDRGEVDFQKAHDAARLQAGCELSQCIGSVGEKHDDPLANDRIEVLVEAVDVVRHPT
jgi:hypothetical protein